MCALWDRAGIDKENIPIIVEVVDHPDVIDILVEETLSHWQQNDEQFGQQRAEAARNDLRAAIRKVRDILESDLLASIMNHRDKHLAHSLAQTGREKVGPITPMKLGDEREMLTASCEIVEVLHRVVNGASFSFADARDIDRKNAEALWTGCKFNIAR